MITRSFCRAIKKGLHHHCNCPPRATTNAEVIAMMKVKGATVAEGRVSHGLAEAHGRLKGRNAELLGDRLTQERLARTSTRNSSSRVCSVSGLQAS
jgi:hypothetical protein